MNIVSYHTPNYQTEARRLEASCRRAGLTLHSILLPDAGGWRKNAHLRPGFLLQWLPTLPPGDLLVSLDADCVVHRNFTDDVREMNFGFDVAVHFIRPEKPCPGTLILRNTSATLAMLTEWSVQNDTFPERNDRENFRRAVLHTSVSVTPMPPALCWIVGVSEKFYPAPPGGPVIEHLQASREYRNDVHSSRALIEHRRRRLRELEASV